jgi:hypothetical protein
LPAVFENQGDGFSQVLSISFEAMALAIGTGNLWAVSDIPVSSARDDRGEFIAHMAISCADAQHPVSNPLGRCITCRTPGMSRALQCVGSMPLFGPGPHRRLWNSQPPGPDWSSLWSGYAASFDGACFKYSRISALTRSISAR